MSGHCLRSMTSNFTSWRESSLRSLQATRIGQSQERVPVRRRCRPNGAATTRHNLHHTSVPIAVLRTRMATMHIIITLIQEPWVLGGAINELDELVCFRNPGADRPRHVSCQKAESVHSWPNGSDGKPTRHWKADHYIYQPTCLGMEDKIPQRM